MTLAYLVRDRRKEECSPHGAVRGHLQGLLTFEEYMSMQEVVDDRVPLPVVLRPAGGIPPVGIELTNGGYVSVNTRWPEGR